jgi:hypothetical protein
MSSLEQVVEKLLLQAKIPFEREKIFKDCYNGRYRFDFVAKDLSFIIEVQGAQHYQFTSKFYKTKTEFKKAQERDRRKISYCLAHNLRLYIIPYWEIEHLHSVTDLFQSRFIPRDKYHNDNVWSHQKVNTKAD